ncbi:MAG: methyltransferase domain-containing protein [Xanthobacteraceae bacterium]|nr:methyltransferase domain-containing protein [Xanthobacteraceae bacterium]
MLAHPPLLFSSGDPVLDRRLDWARGLMERGEAAAAAELLHESVAGAPDFLAGFFLLGEALARAGKSEEAVTAFRRALALDPPDRLGARLRLARLGAAPIEDAMTDAYVCALFDQYAARFDAELAGALAYRGPALLRAAVERVAAAHGMPARFSRVLDLGCGTGLMGAAIRDLAGELVGVDLSPAMVATAQAKQLYDRLVVGDLLEFLAADAGSFDLILAADVLVYRDDLRPVLAAAAPRLAGLLAFTVETHRGENVILRESLRFAHGEAHLRAAATATGLATALLEPASTRTEKGLPVEGLLAVLTAPASEI